MGKKKKKENGKPPSVKLPEAPASRKSPRRLILGLTLAGIVIAGLLFWRMYTHRQIHAGEFANYNVLLITLDTTRADHLPLYGYDKVSTPNLDRIGSESYVFQDGISHVPLTLPSHTSILTGRLPIGHGVRDNSGFILDPQETTLAEILKASGYATAAFVSAFVLDSRWGLNQGFDTYYDNFNLTQFQNVSPADIQRRAEDTEIEAEAWLNKNSGSKFFAWVHFYDPHEPYDPPEPYVTEYISNPYDGEIAYMDSVIGKLMDKLKQLNVDNRTLIVVTGDHGESLGEHKEATHAMFVYATTQHIPMLIHVPGKSLKRIAGIARHIDLAPTVLDLLGMKIPSEMQGASLIPMMTGQEKSHRIAYSESMYSELHYGWSPLRAVTADQYRYIDAPRAELYDWKSDPGEVNNLFASKGSIVKAMKQNLDEILAKDSSAKSTAPVKMDPDTAERLRALGYVSGQVVSTSESRKIDPKDKIELASGINMASKALETDHDQAALDIAMDLLKSDPDMVDAHFTAAAAYLKLNQPDKGIEELSRTLALRPNHEQALYNMGYAYELKNNLPEAKTWYMKVLANEPKHLFATMKLAHICRELGEAQEARQYFLAAVGSYQKALDATKGRKIKVRSLFNTWGNLFWSRRHFPGGNQFPLGHSDDSGSRIPALQPGANPGGAWRYFGRSRCL